jgi:nicotinate phosphoribosyltransferase
MAKTPKRPFHTASDAEIKSGEVSDVYFARTVQILTHRKDTKRVKAEVYLKSLPEDWRWGVLAGVEEAASLLEGLRVDVLAMDEGTLFEPYQPVLRIEGTYVEWAQYETALLGLLCQASGIATKAARCKKAAGERQVISFGARRMHPSLAPMIERNAFIGGCDGVAVTKSAELIDADPTGTIPHSLVLMVGDTVEALRAFHDVVDTKVRRVALIDTLQDEKFEAIRVAEALGKDLYAVRLDTPSSRRGDFYRIIEEVRWELDLRGFGHVKILASGGIDEYEILNLNPVVDGYGVGTSIANAPVLNFALDIMEIEGRPVAKRGKWSGAKAVYRRRGTSETLVLPEGKKPPQPDGAAWEPLLKPLVTAGRIARDLPPPRTLRDFVLDQLTRVPLDTLRRQALRRDF